MNTCELEGLECWRWRVGSEDKAGGEIGSDSQPYQGINSPKSSAGFAI